MSRNRLFNARNLVLGGLAVAAVAGAMKNRHKVAGLIGARSSEPEPYTYTPPSPREEPAPAVSNYDAPGPPANTATPIPAPEPVVRENYPVDEEAEEAAAAAEAANIGGPTADYGPSTVGEDVDEADRPLEEAGEGVAEGREQTDADLQDNAEPSAGDAIEAERQIDDVIEEADNPTEGESLEIHDHIHSDEIDEEQLTIEDGAPPAAETESEAMGETEAEEHTPTVAEAKDETEAEEKTSAGSALGETATGEDAGGEQATSAGSAMGETPASEKSSAVWRSADEDEQPTVEQAALETTDEPIAGPKAGEDDDGDDGSEWQTWSGRAVDR